VSNGPCDVGVLHCTDHHQIDRAQEGAQFVEQAEIGIDQRIGLQGLELDQEVDIALPGYKVVTLGRANAAKRSTEWHIVHV